MYNRRNSVGEAVIDMCTPCLLMHGWAQCGSALMVNTEYAMIKAGRQHCHWRFCGLMGFGIAHSDLAEIVLLKVAITE